MSFSVSYFSRPSNGAYFSIKYSMSLYALCVRVNKDSSYVEGRTLTFAVIDFRDDLQNHSGMGGYCTAGSCRPTRQLARRA